MDAFVNPLSGDYVMREGLPERDPAKGLANAAYLRLKTPLGSWWQDANFGSRLYELKREKDVNRISVLAKQYCEIALQPILDDGRASQIEIDTEQRHNGRLSLHIIITDAAGERFEFTHHVEVA